MTDQQNLINRLSPLGGVQPGYRGQIRELHIAAAGSDMLADDLEKRLIELGFIEGALVEVLHQGPFGGDPIAVRVNGVTIALRRREAMAILVTPNGI